MYGCNFGLQSCLDFSGDIYPHVMTKKGKFAVTEREIKVQGEINLILSMKGPFIYD